MNMFTVDETIILVNLYLQSKTVVIRSKRYLKKIHVQCVQYAIDFH